jgi:hypothetical protein
MNSFFAEVALQQIERDRSIDQSNGFGRRSTDSLIAPTSSATAKTARRGDRPP